jgi:hypothetical protein
MRYTALLLLLAFALPLLAAKPAVLFVGHIHASYVAKPLDELGLAVDCCDAGALAERLATKKYNVVVPLVNDPRMQAPLEAFLAAGGGVFVPMPFGHISQQKEWFPNPEWAAGYGATLRWEQLAETDPKNGYTDMLSATTSWSTQVSAPVNDGVKQVLTLVGRLGWWPPLGIDFSKDWTVVVRFAPSVKGTVPDTLPERLRAYLPKAPSAGSQPLLAVRQVGAGRMALSGIGTPWSFDAPEVCPTVEATLSEGVNGKKSDWLRVYANTFRWLAEPSQAAGYGGATTPDKVLHPKGGWPDHPPIKWDSAEPTPNLLPLHDTMPQLRGLVGARTALSSGTGTVADYATAARAAGLDYLVFLEDALKMDTGKFDTLVAQCKAASNEKFAAIPGLLYEDAQGNHLYTFGDNTRFPRPEMVLPDGRLNTTTVSRTEAMFAYIFQYQNYRNVFGFWNHRKNFLPIADYKLYNSFPIYTFENGTPVDDAFADFQYLMGLSGCHTIFAFEMMTSPEQVAMRAKDGWQVVATLVPAVGDGTYVLKNLPGVEGLRKKYTGSLGWWPPFQYISNGPQILAWDCQNICVIPSGEWWRPDLWEYRARLNVASEKGLKSVTIYDGDRGVFRRWLPGGAKTFTQDLVLAHDRQRDLYLVVEDVDGKRAISMEVWNRNTINNQFICGDRCNFLGDQRLRRKDGSAFWLPVGMRPNMGLTPSKGSMGDALWVEPATALTPGAPTLPIDGKPLSWPSPHLSMPLKVPGEYDELHSYPSTYLLSPEIGIGQGNIRLGFDPAENGATTTPLGHRYQVTEQKLPDGKVNVIPQGRIGKNAWTSWFRLLPVKVLDGWVRLLSCGAMSDVRFGGYQAHLIFKQDTAFPAGKGMTVLDADGKWEIYDHGTPVADGDAAGAFGAGMVAVQMSPGGSVALAGSGDRLRYRRTGRLLSITYLPDGDAMKAGGTADVTLWWGGFSGTVDKAGVLKTMRDFGLLEPGITGYPAKPARGKTLDTTLYWRVAAKDGALEAKLPKTDIADFVPLALTGMTDRWSAFLLDRNRPAGRNFRAIPVKDGTAYALLDPTDADADLFVGHPLTCDNPAVTLQVAWKSANAWYVEAHNPGDKPITTQIRTNKGWTLFRFNQSITLAPGSSRVWEVKGR